MSKKIAIPFALAIVFALLYFLVFSDKPVEEITLEGATEHTTGIVVDFSPIDRSHGKFDAEFHYYYIADEETYVGTMLGKTNQSILVNDVFDVEYELGNPRKVKVGEYLGNDNTVTISKVELKEKSILRIGYSSDYAAKISEEMGDSIFSSMVQESQVYQRAKLAEHSDHSPFYAESDIVVAKHKGRRYVISPWECDFYEDLYLFNDSLISLNCKQKVASN